MQVQIHSGRFGGTVSVPPSKSAAHRMLIAAALADGTSVIRNFSPSEDLNATIQALRALGAGLEQKENEMIVHGTGGCILPPGRVVDCGESGSTLRFLIPLFSLCGSEVCFAGRGRLMQRPLDVYERIFAQQGLCFQKDACRLHVNGALRAGEYSVEGNVSSQFISGLLFALPLLEQDSVLRIRPPFESAAYVHMTLDALRSFQVRAGFTQENTIEIPGGQQYAPCRCTVEGDYSQAAFFAVPAAVRGGITIRGLAKQSLQGDRVLLEYLARCGARFHAQGDAIRFEASELTAQTFSLADCPDLGPALMVLGTFCRGTTVLTHAGRLRMKESDRIASMQRELRKMGAHITSDADRVAITGAPLHASGSLSGCADHRVVMALASAAVAARVDVCITGAQAVGKSWPDFFDALRGCGCEVQYGQEPESPSERSAVLQCSRSADWE